MIELLEHPMAELLPSRGTLERVRRLRLGLMICGSVGLIPWIVFLSVSLPTTYVAQNWSATGVGFDALLVTLLATTAILGWQRRQLLLLTAFATGMLLICDAWFDTMTAQPGDRWLSIATAIFGELPLAAILIVGALRPAPVPWPRCRRRWCATSATPRASGCGTVRLMFAFRVALGGAGWGGGSSGSACGGVRAAHRSEPGTDPTPPPPVSASTPVGPVLLRNGTTLPPPNDQPLT